MSRTAVQVLREMQLVKAAAPVDMREALLAPLKAELAGIAQAEAEGFKAAGAQQQQPGMSTPVKGQKP